APHRGGAHEHPRGPPERSGGDRDRPATVRPLAAAIDRALRTLRLDSDVAKADAIRAWTPVACAVIGPDATRTTAVRMDGSTLGATLRTKGRFYFLCEVARQQGNAGGDVAKEVADLARQEYYYDLSAGIEVSLRKALRQANRRAAQRLRDQRGRVSLHCACAVVVNNELYAARIGAAQVFLVRRARLFLPGDEPGELADFVHRTTTREAESLGGVADVLPDVWRQSIEPGDTLILASGGLVEGLGAEALKNAAITLHPRAAAEHINNRAVADGVVG